MSVLLITITASADIQHEIRIDGQNPSSFILKSDILDDVVRTQAHGYIGADDVDMYARLRKCVGIGDVDVSEHDRKQVGEWLYKLLFPNGLRAFDRLIENSQGGLVEIQIEIKPSTINNEFAAKRLQRIPWEMIWKPGEDRSWGQDPNIVCVRVSQRSAHARHSRPLYLHGGQRLSVGLLCSSPTNAGAIPKLDHSTEMAMVQQARANSKALVMAHNDVLYATEADLYRALSPNPPNILLISLHARADGTDTRLICCKTDDPDRSDDVDFISSTRNPLRDVQARVPIVTAISACQAVDLAHSLADQGLIAIALSGRMRDEVAVYLFRHLLQHVLLDNRIHVAVHELRKTLYEAIRANENNGKIADLADWQAHFVVCVIPKDGETRLLEFPEVGQLTVEALDGETLKVTRLDVDEPGQDESYSYLVTGLPAYDVSSMQQEPEAEVRGTVGTDGEPQTRKHNNTNVSGICTIEITLKVGSYRIEVAGAGKTVPAVICVRSGSPHRVRVTDDRIEVVEVAGQEPMNGLLRVSPKDSHLLPQMLVAPIRSSGVLKSAGPFEILHGSVWRQLIWLPAGRYRLRAKYPGLYWMLGREGKGLREIVIEPNKESVFVFQPTKLTRRPAKALASVISMCTLLIVTAGAGVYYGRHGQQHHDANASTSITDVLGDGRRFIGMRPSYTKSPRYFSEEVPSGIPLIRSSSDVIYRTSSATALSGETDLYADPNGTISASTEIVFSFDLQNNSSAPLYIHGVQFVAYQLYKPVVTNEAISLSGGEPHRAYSALSTKPDISGIEIPPTGRKGITVRCRFTPHTASKVSSFIMSGEYDRVGLATGEQLLGIVASFSRGNRNGPRAFVRSDKLYLISPKPIDNLLSGHSNMVKVATVDENSTASNCPILAGRNKLKIFIADSMAEHRCLLLPEISNRFLQAAKFPMEEEVSLSKLVFIRPTISYVGASPRTLYTANNWTISALPQQVQAHGGGGNTATIDAGLDASLILQSTNLSLSASPRNYQ